MNLQPCKKSWKLGLGMMVSLMSWLSLTTPVQSEEIPVPLTLPKRIYITEGEGTVRFANFAWHPLRGAWLFDVERGPGAQYDSYFLWQVKEDFVSPQILRIGIYSALDFQKITQVSTEMWKADPAQVTRTGELRWLAIGDSLTAGGQYIRQTLEKLKTQLPGITVKTVGTQPSKASPQGIRHEGQGGWSWERYLEAYTPKMRWQSPFVFGSGDAMKFDFGRYLKEHHGGIAPDVITLFLGANDVYGISADFSQEKVDILIERAQRMVAGVREDAPNAVIGIIPPPPPSEQHGFGTNYRSGVTEWQYRRAMQSYIAGLLQAFDGRWEEGVYIVPGYLSLDPETAYPSREGRAVNALHPKVEGYEAISEALSAWFIYVLSVEPKTE